MKNFWQELSRPFFVLAPMEDVTDTVFRRIVASCGRPAVFFTEFTSVDGLFSQGHKQVAKRLQFTQEERPLVAQIWGMKPENYYKAAQLLVEMGFDGIDINMGCPQRRVVKQGACSALIKNQVLAKEIIQATKEGAGSASRQMPVSVKTRIGFQTIQTEEWIGFLLRQGLDALTVHARTVREMSDVPAHWDELPKIINLRNMTSPQTVIIGNGDVMSREEAEKRAEMYRLDGVMIGRGIFHDPWIFNPLRSGTDVTFDEKIDKLIEHISLFQKTWNNEKSYSIMKKFFKCYTKDIPGAAELRAELFTLETPQEVIERLTSIKQDAAEERESA